MKSAQEHRWAVDAIEEGMARVEEEGGRVLTLPLWLLPAGVKEGQLLKVTRAGEGGASILTITIDAAATAAALKKSRAQVGKIAKASKRRDDGGDVTL